MEYDGHTLHRIRALRDFGDVKAGDLGGWIESEDNLDPDKDAWVYDNAKVMDSARVEKYARVWGMACIKDNAIVSGASWVKDNALVLNNARVDAISLIKGHARVVGNAYVRNSSIMGEAYIADSAKITCGCYILGNTCVCGDSIVTDSKVHGCARLCNSAEILNSGDYICIDGIGSRLSATTAFRDKELGIAISCGCFLGNLSEFKKCVIETHGDNKYAKEYLALIDIIKAHFEIS